MRQQRNQRNDSLFKIHEFPKAPPPIWNENVFEFFVPVQPIGKPRMTRRDKWSKRPCTQLYWDWKDYVQTIVGSDLPSACDVASVDCIAFFSPPQSWSQRKRDQHLGCRHTQKPDGDNILKAILDACWKADEQISDMSIKKRWATYAGLQVYVTC